MKNHRPILSANHDNKRTISYLRVEQHENSQTDTFLERKLVFLTRRKNLASIVEEREYYQEAAVYTTWTAVCTS